MKLPALLALLVLPTCASLPRGQVALPPFPLAVPSTHGPVPVVLVHHMRGCGMLRDSTRVYYGCFHPHPPLIEIEDTMSLEMKWRTLSHERVHLALSLSGATLPDGDAENAVAEAIAEQETHALEMGWPR